MQSSQVTGTSKDRVKHDSFLVLSNSTDYSWNAHFPNSRIPVVRETVDSNLEMSDEIVKLMLGEGRNKN